MEYETIKYELENAVGIITLNRPERLNALSPQLLQEMSQLMNVIQKDDNVRSVIITGASRSDGRPCFSAGVDLKEISTIDPTSAKAVFLTAIAMFADIEDMPKPTIAAIDGVCTAGGFELALVADIRIAATTAQIRDLHVKNMGGMGGFGLPTRLTRLVGTSKAKEIVWTGDMVSPEEALRIGLVNRLCAPENLIDEAKKLAYQIAEMRPLAVEANKACINAAAILSAQESLRFTELWHRRLGAAGDRAATFLKKKEGEKANIDNK